MNMNSSSRQGGFDCLKNPEATPEDAAMLVETFDELLSPLEPDQRLTAIYKFEGHTNLEIARLLDCAVSTVERRLRRIRRTWSDIVD